MIFLSLLGCTSATESGDTAPEAHDSAADDSAEVADADGDGTPAASDCDDQDPTVTADTERMVPAGPFLRGDDSIPDAHPVREITLGAFCMDVYEVTNEQFIGFMEARAAAGHVNVDDEGRPLFDFLDADDSVPERIVDDGGGQYSAQPGYEGHPVTEVYHWAGVAYCASLGKTLPTEAQWEKAAGGPDEWMWPWGVADLSCDLANIRPGPEGVDPEGNTVEPCVGDTTPVGLYAHAPGPYGHLDLAGNVAEWVSDWYRVDYYATSSDTDPQGPDSGWSDNFPDGGHEARVSRGGAFASSGLAATTTSRYVERADGSSNGLGFRCARNLD